MAKFIELTSDREFNAGDRFVPIKTLICVDSILIVDQTYDNKDRRYQTWVYLKGLSESIQSSIPVKESYVQVKEMLEKD